MTSAKNEFNWYQNYEALKAYILERGHLPDKHVVENRALLSWAKYQRKKIKEGSLDNEKQELFESLLASRSTEHTGGKRKKTLMSISDDLVFTRIVTSVRTNINKKNVRYMNFDLSTIDWTAISSIVSLIMVIATFVTLRVNSKQLKEIKRQWKEEHRPNLQILLVVKNEHFLVCVSNVGNDLAINVKLKYNDFFKETLFARQLQEAFVETENIPFVIQAHDSKYFYLMPTMGFGTVSYPSTHETISGADFEKWVEEHGEDIIEVGCCYSSQSGTDKYISQYSTLLKHCFGHTAVVIDNEIDAILEVSKSLQHIEKLIKNQK